MTFEEILDQATAMLQRRGRVSYRTLTLQFHLDAESLEALKEELIEVHHLAVDQDGRMLVWMGDHAPASLPAVPPTSPQAREPLAYTPPYLAEKILTSKNTLEGERKQVTVLFADLKDSTELIRGLDPEAAQHLLDPALHCMMDAVHRFEGTVNQVLGDGIMALFGAPIAHEDHALRACYAALAMQAAMRAYTDEVRRTRGLELRMRVGLNSGAVVVRAIGNDLHMDYSAVGETTVLAARMEQTAMPGTTRLTAATLRLVEGLVQVTALGPVPVKGLVEPVEVFELVSASALRGRFPARVAGGLTRFVGRDTELAALHQLLARAGAGHGQIVAAVGEAGVGKSRLVYEFVHSHHTRGWRVLESASVSYGKATPYFPVVDLLKRYVHVEEGDDPRTIRAKVTGQILTLDESLQETLPALLSLLDALPEDSAFLALDPPQRRQRTLDGLKRILLRESQVQPLLLVFEDLHWIDSETQALLDSLIDSLPTARLLLLVNYRPEYQHGWGSKTYYTQLRLDPLSPASAEAVLDTLLGQDPSLVPLKQLLIARTEGNPFFLEESVRTLVETGVLVGERGAYRSLQPLDRLQVPATVHAVLAARIDRLPPEEKHLLQTAAVIGTEVPYALLQAIVELSEEELRRGLGHLQAAEFLYETSLFPELEYTFKHALTQEVAYGSLLLERRRVLHGRIVEALEALAPDRVVEQVERLAHHAVRGEVWVKALAYCRQAGAKALAGSAYREAKGCFEQALAALVHLPPERPMLEQAVDLRDDLYQALVPLGEWEQILTSLRDAETIAAALEDQRRLGQVCRRLAMVLRQRQDCEPALAYCQRTHAIATGLGDVETQMVANVTMGQLYFELGGYRQAMACLQQTLTALHGKPPDRSFGGAESFPSIEARVWMVQCLRELGEFADGVAYGDEALQIAEAVARPLYLLRVYTRVGQLHVRQGTLHHAISLLERAVAVGQDAHIPVLYHVAASYLALASALAGRATDALALLEQSGRHVGGNYFPNLLVYGEAYLLTGYVEEAHVLAERVLADVHNRKTPGWKAWVLRLLGDIAARRDPPEGEPAVAHYQQALVLADALGMRPLVAHCHHGLGTLYAKTGQAEQARAELSTAIALYREMAMTFWLPQTETALAQVEE